MHWCWNWHSKTFHHSIHHPYYSLIYFWAFWSLLLLSLLFFFGIHNYCFGSLLQNGIKFIGSIYWNRIIFGLYWVLLINYTIRSDEISLIFPQWVIILSNSLAIDVIIFIIIPIKLSYQHRIQINVILFLFYRILTKLCKEY